MSSDEKPKIIVDDDWKSRVQAEKESLRSAADTSDSESAQPAKPAASEQEQRLPPASFDSLVSLLVTQTLAALGQIPLGDKQEPVLLLDHAKHYIDLLGILEEKSKGNLSAVESDMLTRVLHELRMLFVALQNRGSSKPAPK